MLKFSLFSVAFFFEYVTMTIPGIQNNVGLKLVVGVSALMGFQFFWKPKNNFLDFSAFF